MLDSSQSREHHSAGSTSQKGRASTQSVTFHSLRGLCRYCLTMKKSTTSTFLFPAENGEQLSRHWPSEQFRTLRKAMKLPKDCVVHACRHTFCTRLGEAGADAFVSQRLAGHSRIVISQRYE